MEYSTESTSHAACSCVNVVATASPWLHIEPWSASLSSVEVLVSLSELTLASVPLCNVNAGLIYMFYPGICCICRSLSRVCRSECNPKNLFALLDLFVIYIVADFATDPFLCYASLFNCDLSFRFALRVVASLAATAPGISPKKRIASLFELLLFAHDPTTQKHSPNQSRYIETNDQEKNETQYAVHNFVLCKRPSVGCKLGREGRVVGV